MPDDDFDLYPGDNRPEDVKLDAELLKILESYAELDQDSAKLNKKRADLRAKADKLGVSSHALQDGVFKLKKQTKAERLADEKATKRLIRAAEGRQAELWPVEVAATEKRATRKAEKKAKDAAKAAEAKAKSIEAGDDNPRSDPKRGGAGRARNVVPIKPVADDAEQTEGEAVLDGALAGIKARAEAEGAPLSQSAQAAAVRDKLGLK